jgi:thiosulfate dehydrogenase
MSAAWQILHDPIADTSLTDSPLTQQIRRGYRLFTNTPGEAPALAPGRVACANCHLNAGQRERALPLVGVAGMFPEYNTRAARIITLADRVVDCFVRSENAPERPATTAPEVLALSAYITWLGRGYAVGENPSWRNRNAIAKEHLLPVAQLDPAKGEQLYTEKCASCHGEDGQGVQIGDKKAAPLWGEQSWNDGAGLSRIYTLAGYIRYTMPYLDPGSLKDDEAQQIAAYITSKPRPAFGGKAKDYPIEGTLPPDAVYYRR